MQRYLKTLERLQSIINIPKDLKTKLALSECSKHYVIMSGCFDMNSTGHMGMFGGTLNEIKRLDLWK
jgi:hypothetical protein